MSDPSPSFRRQRQTVPTWRPGAAGDVGPAGLGEVGLNTRFSLSHADNKTITLATLNRRLIELRMLCLSGTEDSRMSVVMFTLDTASVKATRIRLHTFESANVSKAWR